MNTTQVAMFVVFLIFWIPSVYFIFIKRTFVRNSEIVVGKVIDIEPLFQGAKYTLEIEYDSLIETTTIIPNTRFQTYRIGDEIHLYRNDKNGGIRYRVKGSIYVVPFIAMTVSLFFFLVSLGA